MERPPLVVRTRVITNVEDELIELQRDADADHYELEIKNVHLALEQAAEGTCPHYATGPKQYKKRECAICWTALLELIK